MAQKVLPNTVNLDFAKNIPMFSGLSDIEKDALLKDGSAYFYPRKEFLFRQEDLITHLYVICRGTVRLFHETPDGHEVTNHIRIAGDTIGTTGIFLSDSTHHLHAMAVSDVTTLEFSAEWLKKLAQKYGTVASNLLCALSQRAYRMEVEVENRSNMSAVQHVACFLKRTCDLYGFNPKGFDMPYSKTLIASRLGLTRETLSRAFLSLKELGITIENKYVAFHDIQSVERNICGHCSAADCTHCGGEENCHAYKCGIKKSRGTVIDFPTKHGFSASRQAVQIRKV